MSILLYIWYVESTVALTYIQRVCKHYQLVLLLLDLPCCIIDYYVHCLDNVEEFKCFDNQDSKMSSV